MTSANLKTEKPLAERPEEWDFRTLNTWEYFTATVYEYLRSHKKIRGYIEKFLDSQFQELWECRIAHGSSPYDDSFREWNGLTVREALQRADGGPEKLASEVVFHGRGKGAVPRPPLTQFCRELAATIGLPYHPLLWTIATRFWEFPEPWIVLDRDREPEILKRRCAIVSILPAVIVADTPLLGFGDLKDPMELIKTLMPASLQKGASRANQNSKFLWKRFWARERATLRETNTVVLLKRESVLVGALNRVLAGRSIYSDRHFPKLPLSDRTRLLLLQKPTGSALVQLHRFLLEDAYPKHIRRFVVPTLASDVQSPEYLFGDPYCVQRYFEATVFVDRYASKKTIGHDFAEAVSNELVPPGGQQNQRI